jgi:hypothetical protein
MRRIDRTLQAFVETEILPLYEGFDRAHGVDHERRTGWVNKRVRTEMEEKHE